MPDLVLIEARKPVPAQILGAKVGLGVGQRATVDRALAKNLWSSGFVTIVQTTADIHRKVAAMEEDFRISAKSRKVYFDLEEEKLRSAFDAKVASLKGAAPAGKKTVRKAKKSEK